MSKSVDWMNNLMECPHCKYVITSQEFIALKMDMICPRCKMFDVSEYENKASRGEK